MIGIGGLRDVNNLVNTLAPGETPQRKRLLAKRVLAVFGDDRGRLTPEALLELIQRHSCCVHDQEHRCPLFMCVQAMCWELNVFFGVGNDEDKAFRRCSDTVAARPLRPGHSEEEL